MADSSSIEQWTSCDTSFQPKECKFCSVPLDLKPIFNAFPFVRFPSVPFGERCLSGANELSHPNNVYKAVGRTQIVHLVLLWLCSNFQHRGIDCKRPMLIRKFPQVLLDPRDDSGGKRQKSKRKRVHQQKFWKESELQILKASEIHISELEILTTV